MPQSWDIYFPSEGRHTEDFPDTRKIQRLRPCLNPRTRVPVASMITTRPPKPSPQNKDGYGQKEREQIPSFVIEFETRPTDREDCVYKVATRQNGIDTATGKWRDLRKGVKQGTCVVCNEKNASTRWRSWMSRKVAYSIPDGVIGIFHLHNPSGRNMALESTQPLTEMSKKQSRYRPGVAQSVPGS